MIPGRQVMVRADSAFCQQALVTAAIGAGARYSLTIPQWSTVTTAISRIDESSWTPLTAFVSHTQAEQVRCRLVVRRVKCLATRSEKNGKGALTEPAGITRSS